MKWDLPDCTTWEARFHLSADEKRELIQLLAAKGPGAIDEFIASKAKQDSLIAAKIAAWRAELTARAARLKQALEEQFTAQKDQLHAQLEAREAELHGARDQVEAQLRDFRLTRDARLVEVLQRSDLLQLPVEPPSPPTLWQRLLAALRRAWLRLLTLLGLRKASTRKPLFATFAASGGVGIDIGSLHGALYTPAMQARVRSRLRGMGARERLKQLWQQMLGREDYETLAARLMEEELQREAERARSQLGAQEQAMAQRLTELAEQEEAARRQERDELARLEREREEALRKLREKAEKEPVRRLAQDVREELEITGYLKEGRDGPDITQRLVDRFSELVFEDEMKALPSAHRAAYGSYVEGEGVFRKEPMLSVDELSHMDLVGSVVQARLRHPRQRHLYDEDVLVYREMRSSVTHVVLIFDTSGSMEENHRLDAAKRAALALYQAVKRDHKGNRVDLVVMETSVRRADVLEAWLAKPKGFTNTGGAIALARKLLEQSRADRKLVYLITDGLPEAMTLPNGDDIASYPDKCLDYALQEVRKLKALPNLGFAILLLEPEDEMYVKAAERIAAEVEGKVMPTDPGELARKVLVDFDRKRHTKAEAPRAR